MLKDFLAAAHPVCSSVCSPSFWHQHCGNSVNWYLQSLHVNWLICIFKGFVFNSTSILTGTTQDPKLDKGSNVASIHKPILLTNMYIVSPRPGPTPHPPGRPPPSHASAKMTLIYHKLCSIKRMTKRLPQNVKIVTHLLRFSQSLRQSLAL